jgi:hypothetical protein
MTQPISLYQKINEEGALITVPPQPFLTTVRKVAFLASPFLFIPAGLIIEVLGAVPPSSTPWILIGGGLILLGMGGRRALADTPASYWQKIEEAIAASFTLIGMVILSVETSPTFEALGFVSCLLGPMTYSVSCSAPNR